MDIIIIIIIGNRHRPKGPPSQLRTDWGWPLTNVRVDVEM